MYKIIKMSLGLSDSNDIFGSTLELLPGTFSLFGDAVEYIKFECVKNSKHEWECLYDDDDNISTEVEKVDDTNYNIINYLDNQEMWLEKYKIIELK